MEKTDFHISRRLFGGLVVGLGAGLAPRASLGAKLPTGLRLEKSCILSPEMVEGPFYLDERLVRTNVIDGQPGVPVSLELYILDAATCAPIDAARIDIWHADATGHYSGYPGQGDESPVSTEGQWFLRGTQFSDANGHARFNTIYPGWYRGRAPHIHCKILLDSSAVLTTQIFFPDALSEFIYDNVSPYKQRKAKRDTVNTTDFIALDAGEEHATFCTIKEERDRYLASLVVGVDPKARSARGFGRPPGPPPGALPPGAPPRAAPLDFALRPGGPPPPPRNAAPAPRGAALVPGAPVDNG